MSNTTTHTPGPWQLVGPDEFGDYTVNTESDPTAIAAVVNGNWLAMGGLTDRHAANARLIAAAPDLLEALRGLYLDLVANDQDGLIEHVEPMRRALAVIARVEGQS